MERFEYAEYAIGGVQNRNKICRTSEFKLNGERVDCFRSVFLFDEGLDQYVRLLGSVTGYAGEHTSDYIVFDFDGEDLEKVKTSALHFCLYLVNQFEVPQSCVAVFFSGAKGFHVVLPMALFGEIVPRSEFHLIYKGIAKDLASNFEYVDWGIYDPRRIIRLPDTINSKSGLYKILLGVEELEKMTIAEIKDLARGPRKAEPLHPSEMLAVEALRAIYQKWASHDFSRMEPRQSAGESNESDLISLLQGVPEGGRNSAGIRLAGFYMKKTFDQPVALEHMRLWNQQNRPPMDEGELEQLLAGAYRRYGKNELMPEVYTLQQSEKVYREYAKSLAKRSIKTGFLTIDRKIRGIMPGETVVILGRTATGKSALLQHIGLHHAEVSGEPVLFFSLEMPITSVFERALQICIGVGGSEVEDAYRTDDPEMALQANLVFTKIPNFYTVTQAGLTIETIKRIVLYCEENIFHRKTSLVLIDYLGLVREQGKDIYQQVSRVARGLKEASKELSVPIVYLSQVIKSVGEFDPLELGVARDSGAIDEAADFVLGLWREPSHGFGQFSTNDLVLGILKNRKGGTGTVTVEMDKKTLRFRERTGSGLLPGTGEPF